MTSTPKVLDRSTNWFWHAYWPSHAEAIADLTMRFLAGVVQLSLEQSRDLVDEFAPDVTEPSRSKCRAPTRPIGRRGSRG